MEITTEIEWKLTIDDSQEAKDKVFEIIVEWVKKYNANSWEMMEQDDNCQIYAMDCLGPIIEKIVKSTNTEFYN